jgi:hypothetical protein
VLGAFGETVIDATGAGAGTETVIVADAVCPSLEAAIDVLPAATPVTSPVEDTVAIPVLEEVHAMARPARILLLASRVVADIWSVAPTRTVDDVGETEITATGTGAGAVTVSDAEPALPSLEAVITAAPGASAAMSPFPATVATAVLLLCQAMLRLVRTFPLASESAAVACAV